MADPGTTPLHLAQFNIAVLRHPIGHPATAGFEALIDETNLHAEASPGFVWRHGIDARDVDTAEYDDPSVTVNASVWTSPTHLRDFVYRGFHRDVFRRRDEWFVDSAAVMWWLPAGTVPSLDECKRRLAFHELRGSTPYAFATGERVPVLALHRTAHTEHGDAEDGGSAGGTLRAVLDDRTVATARWSADGATATADLRNDDLGTDGDGTGPDRTVGPWLVEAVVDALGTDALAVGCTRLVVPAVGVDAPIAPITHRVTRRAGHSPT